MISPEFAPINTESTKFRMFEKVMDFKYPYDIEGEENIEDIHHIQSRNLRLHGQFLPTLDVWNHEGTADPAIAAHFCARELGNVTSNIILPASHYYATSDAYPLYKFGVKHGRREGYVMLEIDQGYRGRDAMLTDEEKRTFDDNARMRSTKFIRTVSDGFEKGALVSIAPEGHRSYTLNPPEEGVGMMVNQLAKLVKRGKVPDAIILPRGIYKNSETGKLNVNVGKHMSPDQIIEKAKQIAEEYDIPLTASLNAHALMLIIRDLIPEEMHGVYSKDNDREYMIKVFTDKIRLVTERSTSNGKAKNRVVLRDFTEKYNPATIHIPPVTVFEWSDLNPFKKKKSKKVS